MNKKILVNIGQDAKIDIETHDYKGPSCVDEIKKIFDEFTDLDDFEHKAEYYDSEQSIETNVGVSK